MRALHYENYGGIDALRIGEIPAPQLPLMKSWSGFWPDRSILLTGSCATATCENFSMSSFQSYRGVAAAVKLLPSEKMPSAMTTYHCGPVSESVL